jgi:hypothetical protein
MVEVSGSHRSGSNEVALWKYRGSRLSDHAWIDTGVYTIDESDISFRDRVQRGDSHHQATMFRKRYLHQPGRSWEESRELQGTAVVLLE